MRAAWREVERPSMFITASGGAPVMAPMSKEDMMGDPMGTLMSSRTIFMGGEVEDMMADALVSQLLLLDSQDPGKDIKMYINSPGESASLSSWLGGAQREIAR